MKHIGCLFFLLVATLVGKPAQRTCRVLFLDAPDTAPEKLQLFDGATSREVDLPRMNFSRVYQLPAGPLNLRLLPAPPADPTKIDPASPAATVAENVTDFYLIVTSDPANTIAPVRMQVINAGADKLKSGQMLWFNLTQAEVGGIVGAEKLAIKPNSRVTLDPPTNGNKDFTVELNFRLPNDQRLFPLCETRWRHDPRSRSVVFIVAESGIRSPRVMAFPDYRDPHAAKSD